MEWVGLETYSFYTYLPMKMEEAECSETSAYKIHTPGNYPEESIQHSEHGESLKSRKSDLLDFYVRLVHPHGATRLQLDGFS